MKRGAERFYALREMKQAKRSTKEAFDRDSVTIHAESCEKKILLSRTPQQIHHPSTGFQHPPSHCVLRRDKSASHCALRASARHARRCASAMQERLPLDSLSTPNYSEVL